VEKDSYSGHHKIFIEQVMVHAAVAAVFTDSPENGCEGVKLSLDRCSVTTLALKVLLSHTNALGSPTSACFYN
jgi:hypothetical protein